MSKWLPFELHTHTLHSDGRHTLMEMARKARELEIVGIALTDHNTMSGLEDRDEVMEETGLHILPGLEWTTFYGHMVALGIKEYVDWRSLAPSDIHAGIENVHKAGGLAGMAHPFEIGSPVCTGCYWEYELEDWNKLDYIEVWSEEFPSIRKKNVRAFDLWIEKLNEGFHLSATSGRDWHVSSDKDEVIALSYLNLKDADVSNESMIDAVRNGRISVTMGPLATLQVEDEQGSTYEIGDTIAQTSNQTQLKVKVNIDFSVRKSQWKVEKEKVTVKINSNLGHIHEVQVNPNDHEVEITLPTKGLTWLTAEMHGLMEGFQTLIGFTNPIYLKENE